MKFKGDIIITDPCYLIKNKGDYWSDPTYPKWNDFHKDKNGNIIKNYGDLPDCDETWKLRENNAKRMEIAELEWKRNNPDKMKDDWEDCGYGENMDVLGFTKYLCRDTIYGDWSCTTYNTNTNEPIGQFCADAGMVIVCLLSEVLKYNPDFDYHIKKPWTTTLIKDFDGDINFEVNPIEYEDDGEMFNDNELQIIGTGNVNFMTTQTGI